MKASFRQNDNWRKNAERTHGYWPCVICGRGVKQPRHWLWVIDGGGIVATQDETTDPAADCGCHPIGPDCLRRHPELQPFVLPRTRET